MRTIPLAAIVLSGILAAFTGVAEVHAGPDYFEMGDAGNTRQTAQPVTKPVGGSPVSFISGMLSGPTPSGPRGPEGDFQDMYQIIISEPGIYVASTTATICEGSASPRSFDTALYLFDADGFGLLANDDESPAEDESTLPNASNDGTGIIITTPGTYFLAIARKGDLPTANGLPIFQFASPTEVSGPDGPGGGLPHEAWTQTGIGDVGSYTICLQGVVSVPNIPTTSEWGLIALTLLLLTGGTIIFRRQRRVPVPA